MTGQQIGDQAELKTRPATSAPQQIYAWVEAHNGQTIARLITLYNDVRDVRRAVELMVDAGLAYLEAHPAITERRSVNQDDAS